MVLFWISDCFEKRLNFGKMHESSLKEPCHIVKALSTCTWCLPGPEFHDGVSEGTHCHHTHYGSGHNACDGHRPQAAWCVTGLVWAAVSWQDWYIAEHVEVYIQTVYSTLYVFVYISVINLGLYVNWATVTHTNYLPNWAIVCMIQSFKLTKFFAIK